MAITCKNLLYEEYFGDTFELIAGSLKNERTISWFYVESNISRNVWIKPGGGELVFVPENFIKKACDKQIEYLNSCISLYAAGLIIVGKKDVDEIEERFKNFAISHDFPVFSMKNPMELVGVTKKLAYMIMQEENKEAGVYNFMNEILNQGDKPVSAILRQGFSCNINLRSPFFFISIGRWSFKKEEKSKDRDIRFQDSISFVLTEIEKIVNKHEAKILKYHNEWRIFCLISMIKKEQFEQIRGLIDDFILRYQNNNQVYIRIGYSSVSVKPEDIKLIYRQSEKALEFSQKAQSYAVSCFFDELGIMHFISKLSEEAENELICFAKRELKLLIESDQNHGTEYLRTYREFLISDGSLIETANALFIHRNTLIKRLKKIEKLLGKDIRAPYTKTEAMNAFFVFDYYGIQF